MISIDCGEDHWERGQMGVGVDSAPGLLYTTWLPYSALSAYSVK